MKQSLQLITKMIFISLCVFTLIRIGYIYQYTDFFSELNSKEILQSLLFGLRYDTSLTVILLFGFCIILLLPLPIFQHRRLRKLILWLSFLVLVVAWSANLACQAYFKEVYRHAGREVLAIGDDIFALFSFATGPYWYLSLAGLLGIGLLAWIWQKWLIESIPVQSPKNCRLKRLVLNSGITLLSIALLVLGARGFMLSGKRISTVDAFQLAHEKQAILSINGTFNLLQTIRKSNVEEAFERFDSETLDQLLAKQSHASSQDPYLRELPLKRQTPKNVVVLAVESLNFDAIDGLSGHLTGATPFLDSLLPKSRYFTHCYASGQRSIEGIQSILTSVPLLDDKPFLGLGLEMNSLTRIASNLAQQGYLTMMSQASPRRSFRMDGIAHSLGFTHYYGKEDYPILRDYPQPAVWGWDYETLMYLGEKLKIEQAEGRSGFFSFTFTAATHSPFNDPGSEFHIRPHELNEMAGYYNTVRYFDWSLEQFMRAAQNEPWFADTVFIITADHVLRASLNSNDWFHNFHIPLIIYSPSGADQPGVESRFVSHYDIMPTVADLSGEPMTIASFGYSLLSEHSACDGALVKQGSTFAWLTKNGWFSFTGVKNLKMSEFYEQHPDVLAQEQRCVFARLQGAEQRLTDNQWLPWQ